MDSLQRIVSRQFNDLAQKRQSTQLKSPRFSDDFSSFDEQPVSIGTREFVESDGGNQFAQQNGGDARPIKKFTNKLKKTFQRDHCKKVLNCPSNFNDQRSYAEVNEDTLKSKSMFEKIRNIKESVSPSQIQTDLTKLYKQAKIIDVRNGKMTRRTNNNNTDNQNLLLFEELDNSH